MTDVIDKLKIANRINRDARLYEFCKLVKKLSQEKTEDEMQNVICSLDLPLGCHLFIMANYSTIVSLDFK